MHVLIGPNTPSAVHLWAATPRLCGHCKGRESVVQRVNRSSGASVIATSSHSRSSRSRAPPCHAGDVGYIMRCERMDTPKLPVAAATIAACSAEDGGGGSAFRAALRDPTTASMAARGVRVRVCVWRAEPSRGCVC